MTLNFTKQFWKLSKKDALSLNQAGTSIALASTVDATLMRACRSAVTKLLTTSRKKHMIEPTISIKWGTYGTTMHDVEDFPHLPRVGDTISNSYDEKFEVLDVEFKPMRKTIFIITKEIHV